jgi:3-hydroxyacyl-[acyl-carrier-protein] dehydratase
MRRTLGCPEDGVDAETWVVPADHPAFAGHFPGRPIVPGVLLLDWALATATRLRPQQCGWTVVQAKFLRPVGPGVILQLALVPTPRGALAFEVRAPDGPVASGVLQDQAR